jgi:hypothetical protein
MVELSGVTFIWTAVPYRMIWRYNQHAYRGLFLDAGHVFNLAIGSTPIPQKAQFFGKPGAILG